MKSEILKVGLKNGIKDEFRWRLSLKTRQEINHINLSCIRIKMLNQNNGDLVIQLKCYIIWFNYLILLFM